MIELKEVKSRSDLKRFVRFPYVLYKNHSCWIPPLRQFEMHDLTKNPAFEISRKKYWLAKKNGRVVGRIGAMFIEGELEKSGQPIARFGWFDFQDDEQISVALLGTAEQWAVNNGAIAIHGPFGFTDLDRHSMLIEGFEELGTFATLYNYPYYRKHIEKAGYYKSADFFEYEMTVPSEVPQKLKRLSAVIAGRFKIRQLKIEKKILKPRAKEFFALLNEASKDLFGYRQLTDSQIKHYTGQYINFLSEDYTSILVNEKNEIVALAVSVPSLSKALQKSRGRLFPLGIFRLFRAMKKNDRVDLCLLAIKPEYQGMGLHTMIFEKIMTALIRNGIKKAESNPELEDNWKIQALWRDYEVRQHKRRRCYVKYF